MDQVRVDGIKLYHVKNETIRMVQHSTIVYEVEAWIGVEDLLIRELRIDIDSRQTPCPADGPCLDILVEPSSTSESFRFSEFGKEVNIPAPPTDEPERISSPFGRMALYEGALVPLSILYPAGLKRKVRTLDPTEAFFELAGPSNGGLLIKMLFFDEVSFRHKHDYCFGESAREDLISRCEAVVQFIQAMAEGQLTVGDYIDIWEPFDRLSKGWGNFDIRGIGPLSRRAITTEPGLTREILEYRLGPEGNSKVHRLASLYRLPHPHPQCPKESEVCYVVVNVGYMGTTKDLETLDGSDYTWEEVVEYSFGTASADSVPRSALTPPLSPSP